MTIQDLGSIGEFVAAIATVVTLAYLAIQIRQNTKQAKLTTMRELVASVQDGFAPLHNPGYARIFRVGRHHPEELDEDELAAFRMLLDRQLYAFQNLVYQYESGSVEEEIFRSTLAMFRRLLSTPGGAAWWRDSAPDITQTTRRYFENGS